MKAFIPFAVLAFAATSAFAHDWDDNPDMRQSILNDHASGFVGTGFSPAKLERGAGDTYGWIVLDVQAGESHVPQPAAIAMGRQKASVTPTVPSSMTCEPACPSRPAGYLAGRTTSPPQSVKRNPS